MLCELLERNESETVSLSLACASAIVNKLLSSQSSRGAVLKHFVGSCAFAPYASVSGPPSPSLCLAEALLKLLHQKKCNLNDPQVRIFERLYFAFHSSLAACCTTVLRLCCSQTQLDMSGRRANAPASGITIRSFALNLVKKLFSLEQLSAEHLMRPQL